ncbi:mitogen-activated protein kinase kinase kinase 7-like [Amphiura filiformis]|uniref:mitogen-activated protein kinase kinase kinase 7-like n=1 Tax=Amphiura filiformis TaxID=82378 RepID=UPI003B220E82
MASNEGDPKTLDPSSVIFGDKIGEGGFAVVYKVQLTTKDGGIVEAAAKNVDMLNNEAEIEYLAKLQHPYIITLLGYFRDDWSLTIVTEFAEKGDLQSYLKKTKDGLGTELESRWIKESAKGLQYLHHNKVVHRDIKSANYLIMADDTLKLGDFGLAKELDQTMSTVGAGTTRWIAPEVFSNLKRSKMSDVYSYAIVIWEILYRKIPFADLESEFFIKCAVCDGERPEIREDCPSRYRWLMENGWHWDYQQRPDMDTIADVLEADEVKEIEEILKDKDVKDSKPRQNKLEQDVLHPEYLTELDDTQAAIETRTERYSKEMDELEESKQRMRRLAREKKAKKAEKAAGK